MNHRSTRAFTMIELLVVAAVVALLVGMLLPALSKARAKAMRIHCVGRLKNIGLAHRIFATDHADLFPWHRSLADATNQHNFPLLTGLSPSDQVVRIYQSVSNELSTPKIIACSSDERGPAENWQKLTTNHISYFIGLSARETLWQTIMAGDRNLVLNGKEITGRVDLKRGASVAWDKTIHRFQGNIAHADGRVQQLSTPRLKEQLENTGVETNTFLIP